MYCQPLSGFQKNARVLKNLVAKFPESTIETVSRAVDKDAVTLIDPESRICTLEKSK